MHPRFIPAVVLLFAVSLPAQQPVHRLADLQVTATRFEAGMDRVPAAVTVLHGEELRARGLVFLADALRDVPSLATVQTGSYGAPQSLFLRGGESDYTKVLVDGVPMNAPGGSLDLANLKLDNVDRIEIVKGPVSVLYGADAMSGVIQIFTRRGDGRLGGQLSDQVGSLGNKNIEGRVGGRSGPVHLSIAGSRFSSDGTYQFNSGYLNGTGSLNAGYDDGLGSSANLIVRYSDALGKFPTDGSGVPVDQNQRNVNQNLAIGLHGEHRLSGSVKMQLRLWQHGLDSHFRDPQDDAADTTGFGYSGERNGRLTRRGASVALDWRLQRSTQIGLGLGFEREAEYQHSLTVSDFGFGRTEELGRFDESRGTRHVSFELMTDIDPRVTLQMGTRLDHNSAFGSFATWRAGAVWRPTEAWRTWSSVGTGFRAPTLSELFASSAFEVGNPELDPERSISMEIGFERRSNGAAVSLTFFAQQFSDLIQYLGAPPGGTTYGNLGAARSRGVEASIEWNQSSRTTFQLHGSWLSTEVTDSGSASSVAFQEGRSLLRRPGLSGGIRSSTLLGAGQLSLGLNWVGERDDADFRDFPTARVTLPSYVTVDLSAEMPLVSSPAGGPDVDLLFRGDNLFGVEYDQAVGFRGRGRVLSVGGRLGF